MLVLRRSLRSIYMMNATADPVSVVTKYQPTCEHWVTECFVIRILSSLSSSAVDKMAENFPAVPFFLPWLNALWFSRTHKGAWRFNPCDQWGTPKPLEFLDGEES